MKYKNTAVCLITLIIVSCSSVSTQVSPIEVLATSTFLSVATTQPKPTLTQTLSSIETATITSSIVTERLCTPEDFNLSSEFTGLDNLESLRGFRPNGDWLPGEGWEETMSLYNPQLHYAVAGFRNSNQHLYILKEILCRYGENGKYGISEIADFIWLPALKEDEIIIDNPTLESCCFLQSNIEDRLQFRFEWFVTAECNPSVPTAILLSKYDLAGLPQKIIVGEGYNLSVKLLKGWVPNIYHNKFEELATEEMSCVISFNGG